MVFKEVEKLALVKCPECGKQMSNNAKSCPNCGYVEKKNRTTLYSILKNNPILIVIIVVAIIGLVGWIWYYSYNKHLENLSENVKETHNKVQDIDSYYYYRYGI